MKTKKSIQASLKILLLLQEFSNNDIAEAIKMIESDYDDNNVLISYLKKISAKKQPSTRKKNVGNKEPQYSKVVNDLKGLDNDKYILLSRVDKLLREGKVLKKLTDIKKIATQISKDFPPVKSRKDAIPKFMALLVNMPINESSVIVEEILQNQDSNLSESEYQELASFIMNDNKTEQSH